MISVGRLAPKDQWDQRLLEDLLSNALYPTGLEFKWTEGYPPSDGCVLIVPSRYWAQRVHEISEAISRYSWVLLMRVGDEEDLFDITKVQHANARWWVQTPRAERDYGAARLFGVGYTPHVTSLGEHVPDKAWDVFMAAQKTHQRREECFDALDRTTVPHKWVQATDGFTHGMLPEDYAAGMAGAKIAPCPSGAVSPDSFRFWEALEAHVIPIADDVSPVYDSQGFWRILFPDAPFPILTSYDDLPGWIEDLLEEWPANANRITAWWMRQKRRYSQWLVEDLEALGAL